MSSTGLKCESRFLLALALALALVVDLGSRREATTLGFVFALMGGVGGLGALFAGFAGKVDLRWTFVLAAVLELTPLARLGHRATSERC